MLGTMKISIFVALRSLFWKRTIFTDAKIGQVGTMKISIFLRYDWSNCDLVNQNLID